MVKNRKSQWEAEPVPHIDGLTAESTLTRAQVVALIASRMPSRSTGETDRARRSRVSNRLRHHLGKGLLAKPTDGVFCVGAMAAWARRVWPGVFNDLPAVLSPVTDHGSDRLKITDSMIERLLPTDVAGCYAMIKEQDAQIAALRAELAAERKRVRELTPDAQRHREIKEQNRKNATKSPDK
jgi:hypothetical protein